MYTIHSVITNTDNLLRYRCLLTLLHFCSFHFIIFTIVECLCQIHTHLSLKLFTGTVSPSSKEVCEPLPPKIAWPDDLQLCFLLWRCDSKRACQCLPTRSYHYHHMSPKNYLYIVPITMRLSLTQHLGSD